MTCRWTHAVLALALVLAGSVGLSGHHVQRKKNDAFQSACMRAASSAKREKTAGVVERFASEGVPLGMPPRAREVVARPRRIEIVTTPPPAAGRSDAVVVAARARAPPP